ncbi:MAG: DUF1816 domain-containing protein [Waterburya sp.]
MKLPFPLSFLRKLNNHWWVKIYTSTPCCTYYFGPFDSKREAKIYQPGYVEDLVQEKAQGIKVETKWVLNLPKSLTIVKE